MNVDGIRTRKTEIAKMIEDNKPDVLCLQETKLRPENIVKVHGYTCFRRDRVTGRSGTDVNGGGLMILVKENLRFACREILMDELPNDNTTERMGVEIWQGKWKTNIYNMYVPPIRHSINDQRRQNFKAEEAFNLRADCIITGDFNGHHAFWDHNMAGDDIGLDIANWCTDNDANICNDGRGTHRHRITGRLSSPDITISKGIKVTEWTIMEALNTDHLPIAFTILEENLDRDIRDFPHTGIIQTKFAWKKADWTKFQEKLDQMLDKYKVNKNIYRDNKLFTKAIVEAGRVIPRGRRRDPKAWWTEEIANTVEERNKFRELADRSEEDRLNWIKTSKKVRDLINKGKQVAWHEYCGTLSCKSKPEKTWKTIKNINREGKAGRNVAIVNDGKILKSEKEKADAYNVMYAMVAAKARPDKSRESKAIERKIKKDNNQYRNNKEPEEADKPFSDMEMNNAISKMNNNRAAGKDDVYNEFLMHLTKKGKDRLLSIINRSWMESKVPSEWKMGIIIPVPKPGKDASMLESYRPVTLTSCIAKLAERMVKERLSFILESQNKISNKQSGFRQARCTTDPIARLTDDVLNGFQSKKPHKRTLAMLIDFARAFDKVDHQRLIGRLRDMEIPIRITSWFQEFLRDRRAACKVGNTLSKARKFSAGVPQGSVSGPTLFICYINDLAERLESIEGLKFGLFADDLTLWSTNDDIKAAAKCIQKGIEIVGEWCKEYRMEMAPNKCEAILFSNWAGDRAINRRPKLKIGEWEVKYSEEVKLLGIILDSRLTFSKHINKTKREANRRCSQLKTLAGTDWGSCASNLRNLYTGYIRSVLEYGADIWGNGISETNMKKLETVQNMAARIITGCVYGTNTESLLLEADLVPLRTRYKIAVAKRIERMKRMPENDPLREQMNRPLAEKRLVRSMAWRLSGETAIKEIREDLNEYQRENIVTHSQFPPWMEEKTDVIKFYPELVREVKREGSEENKQARKEATIDTLRERGEHDVEIWSDGSVKNYTGAGAAVIYLKGSNNPIHICHTTAGIMASSFRSEIAALDEGLKYICRSEIWDRADLNSLLICTDSQSAIRALEKGPRLQNTKLQEEIWNKLLYLGNKFRITIQFVAAHCGFKKNEKADQEAGEAFTRCDSKEARIQYQSIVATIKRTSCTRWSDNIKKETKRFKVMGKERGNLKLREYWSREDYTLLAQLRCGKSIKIGEYRKIIGLTQDEKCRWCKYEPESVEHIFSNCMGPKVVELKRKFGIRGAEDIRINPWTSVNMVKQLIA